MNRRIFCSLYLILFTGSFSTGMVIPLIPGYAHAMGADSFLIGLAFGITSVSMIFCHPIIGRLSDRNARKPFIAAGLFTGILISIGLAFTGSVAALVLLRFAQGIGGAMVVPVSEAYAGDSLSEGREGFFMGSLNTALWAGFGSGPVIGGLIKDYWCIQAAFLARGIVCLFALMICIFLLPSDRRENKSIDKGLPPGKFYELIIDKDLMRIFVFRISHYICIGVIWAFCPLIGEIRFGMSGLDIGIIIALGTVVGILLLPLFGMIADKADKNHLIVFGGALIVTAMVQLSFIKSAWELYSVSLLVGLGGGIIIPSVLAITVLHGANYSAMGSAVSLMTAADNIGLALGPMLCGVLVEMADFGTAFRGVSLLMACTVFLIFYGSSQTKSDSIPKPR